METILEKEYNIKFEKLKNKFPSISEIIDSNIKILKIKNIYQITEEYKHFFLIKTRNYLKTPKMRYFITVNLASQSSDLLVNLANDLIKTDGSVKLIQYSIYPKSNRVNLLALKELKSVKTFSNAIICLKQLRKDFRKRLQNLKNLI